MSRLALKKTATKVMFAFFLCLATLFLSAFRFNDNSEFMTRLDMASLMEDILEEASVESDDGFISDFNDISLEQTKSINRILKYKIMNGYADNSFKPDEPIRNLEVIGYLQRLSVFLRSYDPSNKVAKRLFRFLSYSEDPAFALEYSANSSLKGLETSSGFTDKKVAAELVCRLTECKTSSFMYVLRGQVVSSVTGKAIRNAYVAADRKALEVDVDGSFSMKFSGNNAVVNIFAAAEGYKPMEISKDLSLGDNIVFRLKPEY